MSFNPDLRRLVRAQPAALPSAAQLLEWVGRPYEQGQCWTFVRDAFSHVGGMELPEGYYQAASFFTLAHDARSGGAFTPQPWDVPLLRTVDNVPILVIHPGIAVDGERFLQTWGDLGVSLFRFDDERVAGRIAGFIRLLNR